MTPSPEPFPVPPLLVALLAPLAIALWWCFTVWLVARFGWARLAEHYRYDGAPPARPWTRFGWMQLDWAGYKGCMVLGALPSGLYLSVWPIFRPGHPPLRIPWHAIRARRRERRWGRHLDVLLVRAGEREVRLAFPARLLEAAAADLPPPDGSAP